MSILHPVPRAELGRQFTHYGWFAGLVPVYIGNLQSEGPTLVERNWVPEWYFSLVEALFEVFCWFNTSLDPAFEPAFPILITGQIAPPKGK